MIVEKSCTYKNLIDFLAAQAKAEKNRKRQFTCPLCGGIAEWGRATGYNNHLHAGCHKCGFRIME